MRRTRLFAVAALIAGAVAITGVSSTSAERPPEYFINEDKLECPGGLPDEDGNATCDAFDPIPGSTRYWGVHTGAGFRIEVPDNWNGDLVMWAHGFRGTGLELTVDNHPLRLYLIENGYAWAASSYRANGYVPGLGAKDTHALIGKFKGLVGRPDRVFMTGASMGGHVTAVAIEQWPNSFDGAMPICGVMGDSELFDFFQDSYLLAEHFAGNDPAVPTPDSYYGATPPGWLGTAFALGLLGPGLTEGGEKYKDAIEQLTGGERPVFDEGFSGPFGALFAFGFGVASTGDGRENVDTVYQLDNDPAVSPEEQALNDAIPRIAGGPQFRHPNGLGGIPGAYDDSPRVSGEFSIPVVSLHTLGELFVPFHMQQIYAERAMAAGNGDLLVVRAIRDVTHCGFAPPELIEAFSDMVGWVDTGTRPPGDAILDRAVVADPQFGCQFTAIDRKGLPACGT